MFEYLIEYAPTCETRDHVIIEAPTLTKAFLAFMLKFPSEYAITDIKLYSPAEA